MIVCHCERVDATTIAGEIACGATTIEDVAARCGAGAHCGGCHDAIDGLVDATTVGVDAA